MVILLIKIDEGKTSKDYSSWKKDDSLIKSLIHGTLTGDVLTWSVPSQTTKEVWKSVEEAFVQYTKACERSAITRRHSCKKESSFICSYIKRFKGICDELAPIQKTVSGDVRLDHLLSD